MSKEETLGQKFNGKTWKELFQSFKPDITDDEVEYILWNETCYPFDQEIAIRQIQKYFANPNPLSS